MQEVIDRCYFCDTPFQVLNCINLELAEKKNADLYILDRFSSGTKIVERLKQKRIFREVILVKESSLYKLRQEYKTKLSMQIGTILSYLRMNKIVKKVLVPHTLYKEMYFSCHILCFRLVRFYLLNQKVNTKFYMFDEGVGSYIGRFERINPIDKMFRRFLFGKKSVQTVFESVLYQPKLNWRPEDGNIKIHKMPYIEIEDADKVNIYNDVFGYSEECAIRRACIFFDGRREVNFIGKDALEAMQRWYSTIEEIIGTENLIVKEHPRCINTYKYNCEIHKNNEIPSEICFMNMEIEDKVLISVGSTAVVTPKIIFDKEPVILLLCKVDLRFYQPLPKMVDFFRNVKKLYRDPEKVFIPESEDELRENLLTIRSFLER